MCTYWSNPDATLLFYPEDDEFVQDCLIYRIILLNEASFNNDSLLLLLYDIDDIKEIRSNERQKLRMYCVYLRKSHECALKYMNKLTWKQTINIAIEWLEDYGVSYIKNEKTIRKINAQFRNHDALSISKVHPKKEPLFFSFFPDVKYLTVGFCNKIIEEGMLSTDMLLSEVKAKILPNCYAKLCKCTLYKDKDNIPDYDEILK